MIGRIDYYNRLLFGVPDIHLNNLQRVQNTAARLVCIVPRFCHITPVLRSLHWLPVKLRINFKILVISFFYKAMFGFASRQIKCLQSVYMTSVDQI